MLDVILQNDIKGVRRSLIPHQIKSFISHLKIEIGGQFRNQEGERVKSG